MKERIIEILRSADDQTSGEALSQHLGISRVSIWKHIQKLNSLGYVVESTPRGYRLAFSPDIPYPWEVAGCPEEIHYFPQLPSTMTTAREMARKGAPHGTVVIAGRQTQGRGRLNRTWNSDDGGLYFTIVVRPDLPPILATRVNLAAAVAMTRALREKAGVNARIKWPNDILIGEKKVCGMISEMETETDMLSFVSIGIGLNVHTHPGEALPAATWLAAETDRPLSRADILKEFLHRFRERLAQLRGDGLAAEWRALTLTLGRRVTIVTVRETLQGEAVDLDPDGSLMLRLPGGQLRKVVYGDCFLN